MTFKEIKKLFLSQPQMDGGWKRVYEKHIKSINLVNWYCADEIAMQKLLIKKEGDVHGSKANKISAIKEFQKFINKHTTANGRLS